MEEQQDSRTTLEAEKSKGFGGGMIVGIVIGACLFLLTIQMLYLAK
jgi:hypothetical protein